MKLKSVNTVFTLIINYKLFKVPTTLRFVNVNIYIGGDSTGSNSSYGLVLHSYIWMAYNGCLLSDGRITVERSSACAVTG
jgi:hypothetical protein